MLNKFIGLLMIITFLIEVPFVLWGIKKDHETLVWLMSFTVMPFVVIIISGFIWIVRGR